MSRVAMRLSRVLLFAAGLCLTLLPAGALRAATSEIGVDLRFCTIDPFTQKPVGVADFVAGERIRGVVDIANPSPEQVSVGYPDSKDRLFIEVFRASDMHQLARISSRPFVSRFRIDSGEGQKLEVFLGDHYGLREPSHYLAKPVLVHNGVRYEGSVRAFDIVDGIRLVGAMQMFANRPGLQREFAIVYWNRNHSEHLFLTARDVGGSARNWETFDLGAVLRIDRPTVSILPKGEVVVLHRLNRDQFVRSEFWSLPDDLEFRLRETVQDPETAGTARVRELYREGGVKPKVNPWWKFW
ncbi:MAG: hypothetical protein ACI4RD_08655 [Kiritimatiellia bacterium]